MEIILEAFQYSFFQRSLIVGIILAVVYALLGNFVVLRKEAIIGHAMSHMVFLGVTLGLLFSIEASFAGILAAILGVLFIDYLQRKSRFSQDSILALTAQLTMAAAIIVLSQLQGYQNIAGFLFGNILSTSGTDLWLSVIILIVNLVVLSIIYRPLTQIVINPDLATSAGTNVRKMNTVFMFLLALTVAAGIKIIGVILLSAFLVIPANTAKNLAGNFRQMIIFSVIISFFGVIVGLILSYLFDTPSGAMIVMVLGIALILSTLINQLKENKK
jgi:zinc transport system permease protein